MLSTRGTVLLRNVTVLILLQSRVSSVCLGYKILCLHAFFRLRVYSVRQILIFHLMNDSQISCPRTRNLGEPFARTLKTNFLCCTSSCCNQIGVMPRAGCVTQWQLQSERGAGDKEVIDQEVTVRMASRGWMFWWVQHCCCLRILLISFTKHTSSCFVAWNLNKFWCLKYFDQFYKVILY